MSTFDHKLLFSFLFLKDIRVISGNSGAIIRSSRDFKSESTMEKLIATLLIYIGANTGYDVSKVSPPEIRLLSAQEMTDEYYGGSDSTRPESGIDSRIFALYNYEDSQEGIILLLDPRLNDALTAETVDADETPLDRTKPLDQKWLDNHVFQEQLLHELIHHVQYQTGQVNQFPCAAYSEREAYLLGGKFLRERHATDPLPNRNVLAYMYSRC